MLSPHLISQQSLFQVNLNFINLNCNSCIFHHIALHNLFKHSLLWMNIRITSDFHYNKKIPQWILYTGASRQVSSDKHLLFFSEGRIILTVSNSWMCNARHCSRRFSFTEPLPALWGGPVHNLFNMSGNGGAERLSDLSPEAQPEWTRWDSNSGHPALTLPGSSLPLMHLKRSLYWLNVHFTDGAFS